jgi:hypothetical protein
MVGRICRVVLLHHFSPWANCSYRKFRKTPNNQALPPDKLPVLEAPVDSEKSGRFDASQPFRQGFRIEQSEIRVAHAGFDFKL